jgi:ABC-type transporter Mla subunit MlaD
MNIQEIVRDLSKELNYLYLIAPPPDDSRIEKIVGALDILSLAALKRTLDEDSKDFKSAIKAINAATESAGNAVQNLAKTADAIAKAVQAVKALDILLQYAGSFIV